MTALLLIVSFLYLSIIAMIWAISIDEKIIPKSTDFDFHSEVEIPARTEAHETIDLSGNDVTIHNLRKRLTKRRKAKGRTMNRDEISRITKILDLDKKDYMVNGGSDLLDLIESMDQKKLQNLYFEGNHGQLQELASLRIRLHQNELSTRRLLVKSLYLSKDYKNCAMRCAELLEIDEENIDGHRYMARSLRSLGDSSGSMKHYSFLEGLLYYDREAKVARMRFLIEGGELNKALEICHEILDNTPEDRHGLIYSARIFDKIGEYDKALGTWETLLGSGVDDFEAMLGLGRTYYTMRMDDEAQNYLEQCLEINPGDSRAKRTLSQVYARSGSLSRALELIVNYCINNPEEISNWEKRLVLQFRSGGEGANATIEDIVALNGGSIRGYAIASVLANEFSLFEKSKEISERGISEYWDEAEFYREMSNLFRDYDNLTMEYKFLKNGIDVCGRNEGFEDDLSALKRFLKIVGLSEKHIDDAIERGATIQRTSCVIERIAQLTSGNVNQSWDGNGKIAMASSSLGRGGAERQVVSCLGGIVSDGRWKEVQLFCYRIDTSGGRFSTYEGEVEKLGVKIDEFGGSGSPDKSVIDQDLGEWRKLISLLPERMKKTIVPLYQRIKQFKPSILHSWQDGMNIDASIAAMIAGVPNIVLFARSMRPDRKTALHIRGRGYLDDAYRSILNRGRVILAHNSNAGSRSYSEWLDMGYDSFPIIHNGVDFDTIERESNDDNVELILEDLGIGEKDKVVGSVFRIVEEKNPELWIDVASEVITKLDNTHFVIVGGGIQLELMREKVERMGIGNRVHLVGQSTDIASWLKRMDLFFLTSRVEGLPNVLIEAQGFGVPVISTDAGGSSETFIDGVTGKLLTNEDEGEIGREIIDWLNRSEKWLENSSANSESNARNRFSMETMYEKLIEIYHMSQSES
ncbi:MAG: hypothetical protein CXT66_06210 [Methanobacteriota archaeon]|nr:MAG: hypothetical protein CXT66_06210 [Euryarchaeota archaeon]